jgi:hypothetical protein
MTQHSLPRYERTLLPISAMLIAIGLVAVASPTPTLSANRPVVPRASG